MDDNAPWCSLCEGKGMVVWGNTPHGTQEPRAVTLDEEADMDVQQCQCPSCNGSGIEPRS
jgi:hypothetical protein